MRPYKINQLLPTIRGHQILDIGCGRGYWVNYLNRHHYSATGIDISLKHPNHHLLLGDAQQLPFKSKQFDTAFMISVLEHVKNDSLALREALRVSRRLILIVPQSTPLKIQKRGLIYKHYLDKTHLRTYTAKTLKHLIKKSGGKIIKLQPIERLPAISLFYELFSSAPLIKRLITRIFFWVFPETNYYLELLAIIKP
jgi:ubiquinone/menaquinone biosynthesis C-methylase UbiE